MPLHSEIGMGSDYSLSPKQLYIYALKYLLIACQTALHRERMKSPKTADTQAARKIFQYFSWN